MELKEHQQECINNITKLFNDNEQYHTARDFSFLGYEQTEVPVNKIIILK